MPYLSNLDVMTMSHNIGEFKYMNLDSCSVPYEFGHCFFLEIPTNSDTHTHVRKSLSTSNYVKNKKKILVKQ